MYNLPEYSKTYGKTIAYKTYKIADDDGNEADNPKYDAN